MVKSLKRGQAAWQTAAPDVCASLRHRLAPRDNLGQAELSDKGAGDNPSAISD
jgi:hypothetical protein